MKDWCCGQNGLGAIEAQVSHVLARRMKRRGMSWSPAGAHNMAQLRCLAVTGELAAWLEKYKQSRWPKLTEDKVERVRRCVIEPLAKEDPASWLKASMPILQSYKCSYPIGQALKALGSLDRLIA